MASSAFMKMPQGLFRFAIPDLSINAQQRSFFALPANKKVVEERLRLYNARDDPDMLSGSEALDKQGFAYVKHQSALITPEQFVSGDNIEKTYMSEVCELICRVTGASRAIVISVAFRGKLPVNSVDESFYYKRDSPFDKELTKLPRDIPIVFGKEQDVSMEPARSVHIDYSLEGLRATARHCRADIRAMAQPAIDAEDSGADSVPRYAAYSVWRPTTTVLRDPLAVCDWRSFDARDLQRFDYRCTSGLQPDGEYMMDAYAVLPPKEPAKQRWYWMPEQRPDEVLLVKFADTAAEKDAGVALGCPHTSPVLAETESNEPRRSVETRVLAFWD